MADDFLTKKMLDYKMNPDETNVWNAFCVEIEKKCKTMDLPAEVDESIKSHLMSHNPNNYSRGYHAEWGYYEVSEGDYGNLSITKNSKSKQEAEWQFLKSIARDVGLSQELNNRHLTEPMWHYGITAYDPVLKSWNENPAGWKYDLRYDGRKYWFECCICALCKVYDIDESRMNLYISECTELMNNWFNDEHWGFNKRQMEFVELSDSAEHD